MSLLSWLLGPAAPPAAPAPPFELECAAAEACHVLFADVYAQVETQRPTRSNKLHAAHRLARALQAYAGRG